MPLYDELLHDVTSLLHFVESISCVCDESELTSAYLHSTKEFFEYIRQLADATRNHLDGFSNRVPADASQFPHFRRELFSIRSGWMMLHSFVQPTVDADTLRLPASMAVGLLHRFRQLDGFESTRFAVFHVDALNYLQVTSSHLHTIGNHLSAIVGAQQFPKELGLIGIPYSQSKSVFLNCLIPHEMGHFAYQNKGLRSSLLPEIEQALQSVAGNVFQTAPAAQKSWYIDRLASWAEEIFCDAFACWLVGPCYSLAYIELFDLCRMLLPSSTLDPVETVFAGQFNVSHPADFFRIKQQAEILETVGWWQECKNYRARHIKLIEEIRKLPATTFSCSFGTTMDPFLIPAFEALLPSVKASLAAAMNKLEVGVTEFKLLGHDIERYLANGVVPSTIYRKPRSLRRWKRSLPSIHYPSTVTLLNVGYKFYLENLDELIAKIQGEDPRSLRNRLKWTRKLEAWLLKAIEDHLLLSSERL